MPIAQETPEARNQEVGSRHDEIELTGLFSMNACRQVLEGPLAGTPTRIFG